PPLPTLQRCGKQLTRDRRPLRRQRVRRRGLAGLTVPIARIVQIAFDAMQKGMHPGAILAALVHDDVVRLVPVVLACPPQRGERNAQARRRARLRLTLLEFGERHASALAQATTTSPAKTARPRPPSPGPVKTASPRRTDGRSAAAPAATLAATIRPAPP